MHVTHRIKMDLIKKEVIPWVNAAQNDALGRVLEISLCADGEAWPIPEGTRAVIRFTKADGTGGSYDTLPDGSAAWAVSGNLLTVTLVPEICTAPGLVETAVSLIRGSAELTTFTVRIVVHRIPGLETDSAGYFRMIGALADSGWEPNMTLGTDETGKVVALPVANPAPGLSEGLLEAIYNLLMDAVYRSSGHEADKAALKELLTGEASGDSGSDDPSQEEVVRYTITKSLTNVTISNGAGSAVHGAAFYGVLTANEGYTLSQVTVTMGGVPLTVTDGVVHIPAVTGNVMIIASAELIESGGDDPADEAWTSGTAYDLTGKITAGARIADNGTESSNDSYASSDYLDCFDADYLYHVVSSASIHFYDVNKAWISRGYLNKVPSTLAVPENAVFFRLAGGAAYLTETAEKVIPIAKADANCTMGAQTITWEQGDIDTDGSLISGSKMRTNIFPISGAASLTFGENVSFSSVALYDANQNFITRVQNVVTPMDLSTVPYAGYSYAAAVTWEASTGNAVILA